VSENCPQVITDCVSKVINSVTISDLEVIVTEQSEAFAPLASSQHTLATYKNPFGFSLQVVQAAEDIILGGGGQNAAEVCFFLSASSPNVDGGCLGIAQATAFQHRWWLVHRERRRSRNFLLEAASPVLKQCSFCRVRGSYR
jgi:hypothetical protein